MAAAEREEERALSATERRRHVDATGFTEQRCRIEAAELFRRIGRVGPTPAPLTRLPGTHACWRRVARVMALIGSSLPDLRGYGGSTAPPGGPLGEGYSWYLLAQPAPLPKRFFTADPDAVLEHVFATWTANPGAIEQGARDTYRQAMRADTIAAMCADYRASFHLDRRDDARDRAAGRRITAPLLVVIGAEEKQLQTLKRMVGLDRSVDVARRARRALHSRRITARARRRTARISRRPRRMIRHWLTSICTSRSGTPPEIQSIDRCDSTSDWHHR